ncbi:MAG: NADH-quinone oxidoreductase subunit N [Armatimonadaceae bacterium]
MNEATYVVDWAGSLGAIAPPLIVIVLGMVVLLLDTGRGAASRRGVLPVLSGVGLIMAAVAGFGMTFSKTVAYNVTPIPYFGQGIVADSFAGYSCIVLAIAALLTLGMGGRYLAERHLNYGEFYALLLFSTAGAMVMTLSFDLVNVFVGLEVLSVALYILAGFARRERRSEEAAVKYFLLGAFASGFLLFGTALVYGSVGLAVKAQGIILEYPSFTNFYAIGQVLRETVNLPLPLMNSPIFVTGIALIIVGLGFKAAIVPFHSYAPDVYEGSPTPVTAFMSSAAKIGAFAAFVRLFTTLINAEGSEVFQAVLWVLAALTMIVGNVMAFRQTNMKRMLAYSSVAHAGYILVGVLSAGIRESTETAGTAILFYLFVYTFMNLGAFAVVIWLGRHGNEYNEIRDYAGLAHRQPLAAAVMAIFMLSLAGIPPTAGFVGKLYLFMSAIQGGQVTLAVIGLVVSAIGLFYYLNIIVQMYFKEPEQDFTGVTRSGAQATAIVAAVATILFGLLPNLLFSPRPKTVPTVVSAPETPTVTAGQEATVVTR